MISAADVDISAIYTLDTDVDIASYLSIYLSVDTRYDDIDGYYSVQQAVSAQETRGHADVQ